ncbi:MAG: M50 family metallopeptidase [Actinomycetota bacterium]|nr:M50 family metallopeptidase [Actinomycetota bacterium]
MVDLIQNFVNFMNSTPGVIPSILLFAVTGAPVAFLHECGHALAAKLLVGGASIGVNLVPDPRRPQGICTYDASRASRLDTVLIALAGPAASAIGSLIVWRLYSQMGADGFWQDVFSILLIANVGAVVINLVPLRLTEGRNPGAASFWTDGRVALDALRGSPPVRPTHRDLA